MHPDHAEPSRSRAAVFLRSNAASVCQPAVAIVVATLAWLVLPANLLAEFVAESGPVESATAILYGIAMVAIVLATRSGSGWKTPTALLIGVTGLVARELDLHRTATNDSVLRVSYYFGAAPLQTKLFALAAVGLFLAAVGYLVTRHAITLLRALKQAHPLATTVLNFFLTGIVAKAFDRGVGMLVEDFGVALPLTAAVWAQSIEETLEACLPLLIMIGSYQMRSGPSVTAKPGDRDRFEP